MRKAICLILVVAICMSMACTVFAAKTSSAGDSGKPSSTPSSNPKTGDVIMYWVLLMALALLALAVVVFLYRKFAL